jgi:hypothetical protein
LPELDFVWSYGIGHPLLRDNIEVILEPAVGLINLCVERCDVVEGLTEARRAK